jgi:type III restriction enzyme
METKGMHLAGSADTAYKQALLEKLKAMFGDERGSVVGELALAGGNADVVCDMVFDEGWRGSLEKCCFG